MSHDLPEAPRHIEVTRALVQGWTGPVEVYVGPDTGWMQAALLDGQTHFALHANLPKRLDPTRPEVRDRLIRHLDLRSWLRDDVRMPAWVSAGLIACAAAGRAPRACGGPWRPLPADDPTFTWARRQVGASSGPSYDFKVVEVGNGGWCVGTIRGDEVGEAAHAPADAAALDDGVALLDGPDRLRLPWPGGPRLWRRP